MTRSFLPLLLCLVLPATPRAEELPDHETLTVAAMAMADGLDPADHAGDWLRLHRPDLLAAVKAGEVDEEEARRRALEDLRQRVEAFDPDEPLTIRAEVYLHPYDETSEAFPLGPLVHGHFFIAHALEAETLPRFYHVLIANMDTVDELPMEPEAAAAFRERRARLHGSLRRLVYATAELRLVSFQNGRDFQAVVTSVDIHDEPERETLLHRIEEERKPGKVVEERLLSEGLTWQAVENHGFEYLAIRLLTVFPEHHPELEDCRKDGRSAGHAVIRCDMEADVSRIPVRLERFYVGGRLARVVVHRTLPPDDRQRRILPLSLRRSGIPESPPIEETLTWQYRDARLRFDPSALAADAERTGFLEVAALPYLELTGADGNDGKDKEDEGKAP